MVSGLATQATSRSALRPSRFPISASVIRSGSERRNRAGNLVLRIRFSAARYSFRNKSSWFTEPVTYARSRTHLLFLMLPSILLCCRWFEYFYHTGNNRCLYVRRLGSIVFQRPTLSEPLGESAVCFR